MKLAALVSALIYISGICCLQDVYSSSSRTSTITCATPGQLMYCSDCLTNNMCDVYGNVTVLNCTSDLVCQQNGEVAQCVESSSVPACDCPGVYPSVMGDPYDPAKYIICTESGIHVEECPDGSLFNPDTLTCDDSYSPASSLSSSSTTEATTPSYCNGTFMIVPINCTHYELIFSDCTTEIFKCDDGQYFNPSTNRCENYTSFSCSKYNETNLYPDSQNCSVYHYCSKGEEPGDPFVCPPGTVFNPNTRACVSGNGNESFCPLNCEIVEPDIPPYVQCSDGTEFYPVDCKTYYICVENSEGEYEPQLQECPDNLVVNPQLKRCDLPILVPICNQRK